MPGIAILLIVLMVIAGVVKLHELALSTFASIDRQLGFKSRDDLSGNAVSADERGDVKSNHSTCVTDGEQRNHA